MTTDRLPMSVPQYLRKAYDAIVGTKDLPWSRENHDLQQAALDKADRDAGPGLVPGRIVAIPHADGHAMYMVTKVGTRVTTLVHLPIGDAWWSPSVVPSKAAGFGTAPTRTIRAHVESADNLKTVFATIDSEDDRFYRNAEVGSIFHVHHCFGGWIRYQVVEGYAKGGVSGKGARPVALIGSWRPHDLFTVSDTGTVTHAYHAEKVLKGEVCRPPVHSICEQQGQRHNRFLAEFAPVPLHPEPFTDEQKRSHEDHEVLEQGRKILDLREFDARTRMAQVATIFDNYLNSK